MSVMLLFGLALGSIGYKQQVLAFSSVKSQYAFYAADAALECALYEDQQGSLFAYPPSDPPSAPIMTCDGSVPVSTSKSWSSSQWVVTSRLSLDSNARCADVTVYKPNGAGTTYIFSQGYDVSCATVASPQGIRFVSRGLTARYSTSAAPVYATWNPSDKGMAAALSNGNLTVTKTGPVGWGGAYGSPVNDALTRATIGKSSGKWYWEVTVNAGQFVLTGISQGASAASYLGNDAFGWGWYTTYNGNAYHSAGPTDAGVPYSAPAPLGTVLGFALDMNAGRLTGYLNGVSQGVMASGLTGTMYPAIDLYNTGANATANFGAAPFAFPPPNGYNEGLY